MNPIGVKGSTIQLNGDPWTIVDVAPAEPLAEMVAAILEDEGFVTVVRGLDATDDVFSHLGAPRIGTTVVLVPEAEATRALEVIAETVTDFEGEELDAALASGAFDVGEHDDEVGDEADGAADRDSDEA